MSEPLDTPCQCEGRTDGGGTKSFCFIPLNSALSPRMTVIDKCGQATKGVWWMSWHREATKDVVACDKLREAGKLALIRRFPNEETHPDELGIPSNECIVGMERTW